MSCLPVQCLASVLSGACLREWMNMNKWNWGGRRGSVGLESPNETVGVGGGGGNLRPRRSWITIGRSISRVDLPISRTNICLGSMGNYFNYTLCPTPFRIYNSPGVLSSWACRNRQGTDQSTCYSMEHIYGHQVASVFQAWATWEEELTVYYKGGNRKRQQLGRSWGTSRCLRAEDLKIFVCDRGPLSRESSYMWSVFYREEKPWRYVYLTVTLAKLCNLSRNCFPNGREFLPSVNPPKDSKSLASEYIANVLGTGSS